MKTCKKCLVDKPYIEFNKYKKGLQLWCKICLKEYRVANKEKLDSYFKHRYQSKKSEIAAKQKLYKKNNRAKIKEIQAEYYRQHKKEATEYAIAHLERSRELFKARYIKNKRKILAKSLARHKRTRTATPTWLNDLQRRQIKNIYENCPSGYHVDHIVPLKNAIVCGLHVPWNLQYLTKQENLKKGNKF